MQTEGYQPTADTEALREQLRHVYWIGGGSGGGKSTIAHYIADEHGLQVYATDDVMTDHAKRSTPEDCPLLHQFMAMDIDRRWVNRSPQEKKLGINSIEVNSDLAVNELAGQVAEMFGL